MAGALCILGNRTGFLGFLFLLPLGIASLWHNVKTAWFCCLMAILGNGAVTVFFTLRFQVPPGAMALDFLYFSLLVAAFSWIMAPPEGGPPVLRPATVYRIIIASIAGALALIPLVKSQGSLGLYDQIKAQAEQLAQMYAVSSGADVVRRSLSERYITADTIMDTVGFLALRGGATASCMALFFMTRRIASTAVWLIRRIRVGGGGVLFFHAPREFIWALSLSMPGIILGRILRVSPLEIVSWNILVISLLVYLGQGVGILMHLLGRSRLPPMMRFTLNIAIFLLVFSPGINAVFLGGIILLGIAENWAPLRTPKDNGSSSSTPGN